MGAVKHEYKHNFGSHGDVWVLWDEGEAEETGYSIEVTGEDGPGGMLATLVEWSFGYEDWSRDVWDEWGSFVAQSLALCQGSVERLGNLLIALESIDCEHTKNYEKLGFTPGERQHLKDLPVITRILNLT